MASEHRPFTDMQVVRTVDPAAGTLVATSEPIALRRACCTCGWRGEWSSSVRRVRLEKAMHYQNRMAL